MGMSFLDNALHTYEINRRSNNQEESHALRHTPSYF